MRWLVNPHRKREAKRKGGKHRPRLSVSRGAFVLGERSPWKGRIHRVNPFLSEVGMFGNPHRRRRGHRRFRFMSNPAGLGVMQVVRNPAGLLMTGTTSVVSAFLTITLPNMLGLFQGSDLMSKVLRALARVAAGSLIVVPAVGMIAPRQRQAAIIGVMAGAGGSFVLDMLGTRIIIGAGDVMQSPAQLIPTTMPSLTGYVRTQVPSRFGAYRRGNVSFQGMMESGPAKGLYDS